MALSLINTILLPLALSLSKVKFSGFFTQTKF